MHNWAVEHNMHGCVFSLSLAGKRLVLQVTALTLNPGSLSIVCIQLGP